MEFSKFKSQIKKRETSNWVKTFSFIGFTLVFVVYWLLFCDPNLLSLNWFSEPKLDGGTEELIRGWINLNVVWILFGLIGLIIIYFVFLKYVLRVVNYDLIPFLIFPCVFGVMLLVSGFIPYNSKNKNWIIFARLIVVMFSSIIFFFISIRVTNSILLRSNDASYVYEDIKKEYEEVKKIKEENEMFTESKKRKSKEKTYIEI